MRLGQFVTLSVFCRVVAVVTLALCGCVSGMDDDDVPTDAGVPVVDAAAPPDAEVLAACELTCPGEALTVWRNADGTCAYNICRPSYKRCLCAQ